MTKKFILFDRYIAVIKNRLLKMNNQYEELKNSLFNADIHNLSDQEASLLFEQYKLFVEMMDKISERRYKANTFFLTANTFLVTVLTGFAGFIQNGELRLVWLAVGSIVGIIFSLTWYRLIRSYAQLNTGKFRIIHLLETRLPARLFQAEWKVLKEGDGSVYIPFTHTERLVPVFFTGLYIIFAFFVILNIVLF